MPIPNEQRPREFVPVKTQAEALNLIRAGARANSVATFWTRNQEHIVTTRFSHFSESEQIIYVWIPKDFELRKLEAALTESQSPYCFFNVFFPSANIFFKATFIGVDPAGLKFKLPETMFRIQRRRDLRYMIPEGQVLHIEFRDPVFQEKILQKKTYNIGARGLAFFISEEEEAHYYVGMMLSDVTFTIRGRQIRADGEVRHITHRAPSDRIKGAKVGLDFKEISQGDESFIAAYIFEESRRFLTGFL